MTGGPTIVTGAAGFAGSHLLDHLIAVEGPDGIVAWDHQAKVPCKPTTAIAWRAVDLLDRDAVRSAILDARPAELYHLAGIPHVGDSWQQPLMPLAVHVRGTSHILDAVRDCAPRCRVVVVSSGLVYRPDNAAVTEDAPLAASSPYGFSKIAQDQLAFAAARADGLDVAIARPFNHIGARQHADFAVSGFARQIALIERGELPPDIHVGNLDARRDVTDVRDVVRAYRTIMRARTEPRAFNVCSGVAQRIGDLLDQLIALSPVRVVRSIDPARLRPTDVPIVLGDATRIRQELGWTPEFRIERSLADVLDYWRTQPSSTP